ncbi:MAG: methyltransferase domain-containing protein [candidate division WOR-3 bacterium]
MKPETTEEIKFDNDFRRASFEERQALDRDFYDKKYSTTDYQRFRHVDRAFIKGIIERYKIPKGKLLLDLGCGTGSYSNIFAEMGFNVVGLDYSKTGVMKAQKLYGCSVSWIVGDAFNMPFRPEKKFDVIFCCDFPPYNLIDTIPEAIEITKKIFDYLDPEGTFIFVWSSRLTGKRVGESVIIEYTSAQVKELFSKCGTIVGEVYTTNKQLFPVLGRYAISKFITRLTSFLVRLHRRNVRIICGVKLKV